MRITLQSTEHFFTTGQFAVRLWTGTDETGQPIHALVAAIAVAGALPELRPIPGPSIPPDVPSYVCPSCGAVSFNPNDIKQRYCVRCHRFEEP